MLYPKGVLLATKLPPEPVFGLPGAGKIHYNLSVMTTLPPSANANGPIILFDAVCVLCSANARFVLERDRDAVFRLASMQSDIGRFLYRRHGIDPDDPSSILIVEGDQVRRDSDALLSIYEKLGLPWKLIGFLRIVPAAIRDPVYRLIARNRYRLFGKRESCWVAPPHYASRIL